MHMESLLKELAVIEREHQDFFDKNNLKLYQYILIGKKPVMIRFNHSLDSKYRLSNELMQKVDKLIMSYYGL